VSGAGARGALAELSLLADEAWLVGGAVRDELLGRALFDFDVAVCADVAALSRRLARRLRAHAFPLSEGFGSWRVLASDRSWQVDLSPLGGEDLREDLARRDLTVNAIARSLSEGELIDPYGGREDLAAGRLRMVSSRAFSDDPLRVARIARHVAELGFTVEPETERAARAAAPGLIGVAAERMFAELRRIVVSSRPGAGLAALERVGATAVMLPELLALHGVTQSPYHHLDAHDHTILALEQVAELAGDPGERFPEESGRIAALLGERLTGELTRGEALRLGALLHDIAKPLTRTVLGERIGFPGHDMLGAELAAAILVRLRASQRLAGHVAALTRHHLRLGFLVHEAPLGPRAIYRYLDGCQPVGADVTLLSVADRLATGGRGSREAIERHLRLAHAIMPAALDWHAAPPRPPVGGAELCEVLGIAPGPRIGQLLASLTEAAYAGEAPDRDAALELARRLAGGPADTER
jgi:poly(A) polymerase